MKSASLPLKFTLTPPQERWVNKSSGNNNNNKGALIK
jgi:hypothetical protein